jgi:hypothetical protein
MHWKMRTITITPLACALLALVPLALDAGYTATVAAAASQAAPALSTAQGELVDVDATARKLSIKTATGAMDFTYDDKTTVTGAQKGVAGLATMAGTQLGIQYRKDGAVNHAVTIEVRAAPKQ